MPTKTTRAQRAIIEQLKEIPDPELGISIYDLGLIYGISIAGSKVTVKMTLTTIGCPLFGTIADAVKEKLSQLAGVTDVEVELTFDPPWDPDKMSKDAKIELGFDG